MQVNGSKAFLLRCKLPREVILLIEKELRPHDISLLLTHARVHYKFVLRQLSAIIKVLDVSIKPWPPLAHWDWSDPCCVQFYREAVFAAALRLS